MKYEIEKYELALQYALACFRSRAMTMTSDQLKSDVEHILSGEAHVSFKDHKNIRIVFNGHEEFKNSKKE